MKIEINPLQIQVVIIGFLEDFSLLIQQQKKSVIFELIFIVSKRQTGSRFGRESNNELCTTNCYVKNCHCKVSRSKTR